MYALLIYTGMCTLLSSKVLLTNQDDKTFSEETSLTPAPAGMLTLESPSTSAARCSSNISLTPSIDLEPVQKKP